MAINNEVRDILDTLKLILDYKLIKNNNENTSINDVLSKVGGSLDNLSEISENAIEEMESKADIMMLMDNITNSLDKNNKALLDIVAQILGIIKTLLRNNKSSEFGDDVFKGLKKSIEDSFQESSDEEELLKQK